MLLSAFGAGQFEDRRRDVDVGRQLAGRGARLDPRAADQQRQVGGGLVGEELAAGQPVLAVEEAVVGGEDDVGVAQPVHRRRACRRPFHAFVDRAQRLQRLLVVDAVGVDLVRREVGGFADEARLVVDVALVESLRAAVRVGGAGEGVVVARRRLRPGRAAEVAVRRGVVELQVEGLFRRGPEHLFPGDAVEDVGLVEAGFAVQRREGAAEVVAFAVFARVPAARSRRRARRGRRCRSACSRRSSGGCRLAGPVPGVPAGRHGFAVVERFVAVAVEELADVDRPVARRLQPGREVVGVGLAEAEAGEAAVGRDVAADVVVVRVAAGQQADPRGQQRG